jgi:hypothetical protein
VSADGQFVAVGGSFNGWGVALIDTTLNSGHGGVAWSDRGIVTSGQADSVTFENSQSEVHNVYASGYVFNGSCLSCMAALEMNLSDGSIPSTWNGGHGVVSFSTGSGTCSEACAILDMDDQGGLDAFALVGTTSYSTGADFTLAELSDDGVLETGVTGSDFNFENRGTGFIRTNVGSTIGSSNGATQIPSFDAGFAVTIQFVGGSPFVLAVGQTTAIGGTNHVAMGLWNSGSGAGGLQSGFGPYGTGDGLSVGPAGSARSVLLKPTGEIVTGGSVGNDMLVCQFTSSGILDASGPFGNGGIFIVDLGDASNLSTDVGWGLNLESDGSIVIGGSTTPSGGSGKIALVDLLAKHSIHIT